MDPLTDSNSMLQSNNMPLMSWDFFMDSYHRRMVTAKKETELEKVMAFAKQFDWQHNLENDFSEHDYEALIITDQNQKIIWVNEGFTTMTGYTKTFAVNKTPRFLQGKETSPETKARIKSKIAQGKPFQDIITNHRKDNSTYKCEVNIIPLYGAETTHFIAFERKVA